MFKKLSKKFLRNLKWTFKKCWRKCEDISKKNLRNFLRKSATNIFFNFRKLFKKFLERLVKNFKFNFKKLWKNCWEISKKIDKISGKIKKIKNFLNSKV